MLCLPLIGIEFMSIVVDGDEKIEVDGQLTHKQPLLLLVQSIMQVLCITMVFDEVAFWNDSLTSAVDNTL